MWLFLSTRIVDRKISSIKMMILYTKEEDVINFFQKLSDIDIQCNDLCEACTMTLSFSNV